ncbi:MAG: hypothetical protein ACI9MC_000113 [Kiritimatiellia bacterium]
MNRLVVIGAGDVGGRVAAAWVELGGVAVGITSSDARHDALRRVGVEPSLVRPSLVVGPGDLVLLATPGSASQLAMAEGLRGVTCERLLITSTTGYHGLVDGAVLADDPPGDGDRADLAMRAERAARAVIESVVVLRLGGLYRVGRGPLAALLRRGSAPHGPADRPLPLVHVHDAVTAIVGALNHPAPRPTYLVVTPPVPTRAAFYSLACARHGLLAPTGWPTLSLEPASYDARGLSEILPEPVHSDWREATEA